MLCKHENTAPCVECDIGPLNAECDALRNKTRVSLGVGDGTGNLFVHGDYDSIKRVQDLIFEHEKLRKDVKGLVEALTELCNEIDKYDNRTAITDTDIHWFKRKARKALAAYHKEEKV